MTEQEKPQWKVTAARKDGTPWRMSMELAPGCEITLSDERSSEQQLATVKLRNIEFNYLNYTETRRRHRPEGSTVEDAKAWAVEWAKSHLALLIQFADRAADALGRCGE